MIKDSQSIYLAGHTGFNRQKGKGFVFFTSDLVLTEINHNKMKYVDLFKEMQTTEISLLKDGGGRPIPFNPYTMFALSSFKAIQLRYVLHRPNR